MTPVRLRTAATALAVAAIGGTILATTAAAAPASARTTITFTETNISDRTFNLGSGHGIAVGYVELVANKLMQGRKQIGHDGETYTVTGLYRHWDRLADPGNALTYVRSAVLNRRGHRARRAAAPAGARPGSPGRRR